MDREAPTREHPKIEDTDLDHVELLGIGVVPKCKEFNMISEAPGHAQLWGESDMLKHVLSGTSIEMLVQTNPNAKDDIPAWAELWRDGLGPECKKSDTAVEGFGWVRARGGKSKLIDAESDIDKVKPRQVKPKAEDDRSV